jgi:transcriptional regulator with XRE-family HTH domain
MLPMEAWTRHESPRFDLRSERLNRGYSRKGLADVIGVHREVLRRLENGTGGITPANAKLIADYFGVTVVELLGESGVAA